MTPYAALIRRQRQDPGRPLLTYLAPGTGERMELSSTSFLNAVAKAAGLLRDELDVEPGDRLGVRLPCHWQRPVWWAACAFVGAVYVPDATEPVTVTSRDYLQFCDGAQDIVLVSLAPFGLPDGGPVPPGVIEAAVAARSHPDDFIPYDEPADDWPLFGDATAAQVMRRAADLAQRREIPEGARFAVRCDDAEVHLTQLPVALAINGSVVLLNDESSRTGDADVDALLATEGATYYEGGS